MCPCAPGQIPRPTDAPQPLSPEASAELVQLPPGFRLQLLAAEPLVREPSGVCWDERGRMFVCELHGYNLEGQYDIEELNKTGQLDRVVRRVQADERAKQAAEQETYGTVKRFVDRDGDGQFDEAVVWADRLPPCFGICAARGGLIVVAAPDIIFLADRDGDDRAEVRETLYTGFPTGVLERRMSCPLWGPDHWIYVTRGGAGRITGPHLAQPLELPNTDFRIRADGTAIEPVSGGTHTIGHTFTERGERFVVSTRSPGIYVAPLPWHYLKRNPNVPTPRLEVDASSDSRVFPTSRPHPWRTRRADDPGFAKYYTDRYGIQESAPNGYFTSACSPLVYQDVALPGLHGQLLACEPAQNLVHRAVVDRDGVMLKLRRADEEQHREFLSSRDIWFHPIALTHAPDGSIVLVDFYREIIEDYSAIPRYLQQQYGLIAGHQHGRVWRLTHDQAPQVPSAALHHMTSAQLLSELQNPHYWRRRTAQRLLTERRDPTVVSGLVDLITHTSVPTALAALYTLEEQNALQAELIIRALNHPDAGVRVHALRLSEPLLDSHSDCRDAVLALASDADPRVVLQLALTLGACRDGQAVAILAQLARTHADVTWMSDAILSSVSGREVALLDALLLEAAAAPQIGNSRLLEPLAASIAAGRDAEVIGQTLQRIAAADDLATRAALLRGLQRGFEGSVNLSLHDAAIQILHRLAADPNEQIRQAAERLTIVLKVEHPGRRAARLARAASAMNDLQQPPAQRLAAVEQLAVEDDEDTINALIDAFPENTPQVRQAILEALLSQHSRLSIVVDALREQRLPVSALSAVQRQTLLENSDSQLRAQLQTLWDATASVDHQSLERYLAGLSLPRHPDRGEQLFQQHCANCHQAHGIGNAVGPDLSGEFQRAEETIVRDILDPSGAIAAGYATYVVQTIDGRVLSGVLATEAPGSIALRTAGGKQITVLRKDIDLLRAVDVSLMPDQLVAALPPQEVADVIAWLRTPPARRVLFDDDPSILEVLTDGDGKATLIDADTHHGVAALRITPPQKYSAQIAGWQFAIRERPGPGQYRYLRWAWKSDGATGVMIELANNGSWPPADAARFRYYAGTNTSGWQAIEVSAEAPGQWTVVTRDLWLDFGDSTLTGIAPTALGGPALFDRIELLQ